ncbi:hypothetical protein DV517_27290 [Streptomyces sp. S816]|nr:hypothetical protein DV517_27290 [Streptomyces sp. S816]
MTTTEHTEFEADAAEAILRRACAVADLDPDGIEILRLGDHAVFRIDGGRTISRVERGADRISSVRREVAVARWLADQGYPAARLITDAEQPIVIEDHPVTLWEGFADGATYASTGEMGVLLRRLHELESPPFSLPRLQPFDKVASRLDHAAIPESTRAFLRLAVVPQKVGELFRETDSAAAGT